jgi:hypothetical protein
VARDLIEKIQNKRPPPSRSSREKMMVGMTKSEIQIMHSLIRKMIRRRCQTMHKTSSRTPIPRILVSPRNPLRGVNLGPRKTAGIKAMHRGSLPRQRRGRGVPATLMASKSRRARGRNQGSLMLALNSQMRRLMKTPRETQRVGCKRGENLKIGQAIRGRQVRGVLTTENQQEVDLKNREIKMVRGWTLTLPERDLIPIQITQLHQLPRQL